jgi:hypothetical protein
MKTGRESNPGFTAVLGIVAITIAACGGGSASKSDGDSDAAAGAGGGRGGAGGGSAGTSGAGGAAGATAGTAGAAAGSGGAGGNAGRGGASGTGGGAVGSGGAGGNAGRGGASGTAGGGAAGAGGGNAGRGGASGTGGGAAGAGGGNAGRGGASGAGGSMFCSSPADCTGTPGTGTFCSNPSWSCVANRCNWECMGGRTCREYPSSGCIRCGMAPEMSQGCLGDPCVINPATVTQIQPINCAGSTLDVTAWSCTGSWARRPGDFSGACTIQTVPTGSINWTVSCGPCAWFVSQSGP